MAFELQDVTNDPDLAESFTISRSSGSFSVGGWTDSKSIIAAWGVVSVSSNRELDMIPEADRVHGARTFHCQFPMYTTAEQRIDGTTGTSDILIWEGTKYRVLLVGDYRNRGGYYFAIGQRMTGS